jgi:hypothetical protein
MEGSLSHACLILTHELFEVCDRSPLNRNDQETAAILLLELIKGSRTGFVRASFGDFQYATSQHHDTQSKLEVE